VNSVTDANGNTATATFDALRRLLTGTAPIAGINTSYSYFPDGTVKSIARNAATPEVTQYTYTLTDQVSVVTDPLGNTVTTTYDLDDRKQTVTSQVTASQNRQMTYSYDALSRLYQVSDTTAGAPGTPLETRSYSGNSNLTGFTDANGHQMTYLYDGLDRRVQTTYPDASAEKFSYDPNSSLLQKTARSGQTIAYTYDALNRLASKTGAGEVGGQVTFGYDFSGLLLQALDTTSTTPYQIGYDTAGRAIGYTDQQGRNAQVQLDAVGNRTRLQWPAGTNGGGSYFVTYSYDALNRMTEIDANGSAAAPLAKYQWDALSRLTLLTHGDGTTDAYAQYDAGDNLLTLNEMFAGGSGVTFQNTWFKNHQRQSTSVSNSAFQYLPTTGTLTYSTDADNAYTAVNAANLTYDGNHNLTYDGINTLSYDVENRLIQAQNTLSGTSQYSYDPMGHRKQKVVAGVTTQFVLAGTGEIADYSGAGAGTPQVLTVRGVGGSPVASIAVSSGTVAYYHQDTLGSTVALTQQGTSGVAETFTYSEFGVPAGGSGAQYLYAGYRYDAETGLNYTGMRSYSPQLGRFLQTDPIGISGGRNLYGYVGNDPINQIDPYGTCGAIAKTTTTKLWEWGEGELELVRKDPTVEFMLGGALPGWLWREYGTDVTYAAEGGLELARKDPTVEFMLEGGGPGWLWREYGTDVTYAAEGGLELARKDPTVEFMLEGGGPGWLWRKYGTDITYAAEGELELARKDPTVEFMLQGSPPRVAVAKVLGTSRRWAVGAAEPVAS
jgi:RHS repeat-associated protein